MKLVDCSVASDPKAADVVSKARLADVVSKAKLADVASSVVEKEEQKQRLPVSVVGPAVAVSVSDVALVAVASAAECAAVVLQSSLLSGTITVERFHTRLKRQATELE